MMRNCDEEGKYTYKGAAAEALAVQDACNLSGVALCFAKVLTEAIWPEARRNGKGTTWVNKHPIVTLFLEKMVDLNGTGQLGMSEQAWEDVRKIAEGKR